MPNDTHEYPSVLTRLTRMRQALLEPLNRYCMAALRMRFIHRTPLGCTSRLCLPLIAWHTPRLTSEVVPFGHTRRLHCRTLDAPRAYPRSLGFPSHSQRIAPRDGPYREHSPVLYIST